MNLRVDSTGIKFLGDGALSWFAGKPLPGDKWQARKHGVQGRRQWRKVHLAVTEAQALAAGRTVRVGRFSLRGNGKALIPGEPDGLVKTVFCAETDRLPGAQLIGAEASEPINGLTTALTPGATSAQLASVISPQPDLVRGDARVGFGGTGRCDSCPSSVWPKFRLAYATPVDSAPDLAEAF